MRKISVFVLLLFIGCSCYAFDQTSQLLSLVKLSPENVTREKIMSILGKPARIDETRKGTRWYYTFNNSKLMLQWNKNEGMAEKFSFNCTSAPTCIFDKKNECKLQEGKMNVDQAVALLGTPKEMVMKSGKQVLYYNYQNSILRLFFRNRTLVDYAFVDNRQASATLSKKTVAKK